MFTYNEIITHWKNCWVKPKGYHRKKDYLSSVYKISATVICKLIYIYRKNPLFIMMLDNDSDLSVSMVYRLLNEGEEVDEEILKAGV